MGRIKYANKAEIVYTSPRYNKVIIVPVGYKSDGASSIAVDIYSDGWWVHDVMCDRGTWQNGDKCTNWQASMVLSDILADEHRWFRSKTWLIGTFLFGGGKARKNGMFKLRKD
jgi:hypothetical protein